MLAYTAIASTATAAFFGAPIWTFLIGAAALVLLATFEHREVASSYSKTYARSMIAWAAWQSAGHATIASGAAYLLGYATRLGF